MFNQARQPRYGVENTAFLGIEIEIEGVGPLIPLEVQFAHELFVQPHIDKDVRKSAGDGEEHGLSPNALVADPAIVGDEIPLPAEGQNREVDLGFGKRRDLLGAPDLGPMLRTVKSEPEK